MSDFDELCHEAENLDPMTYSSIISEKSRNVQNGYTAILGDEDDAKTLFTALLLGAVISDGKIVEKEFNLIKPMLVEAVGEDMTFEDAQEFVQGVKSESRQFKQIIVSLAGLLNVISEDLKNDAVILCLLVCSVDGKVSVREKKWLQKLIGEEV